jgi:transcriptional regulator with XRE-family HTH domain
MAPNPRKTEREPQTAGGRREKVSADLGSRLRVAREQKGMTVRGLARYVGVSPSLVSQIERSRVMPSVGTLYAIANELGLLVDDLFRGSTTTARTKGRNRPPQEDSSFVDIQNPVLQPGQRKTISLADGVRWERLTPAPDKDLEFLLVVYNAGAESCPKDALVRHGGKEYAYLISGHLGIKISFEEFELGPGDSISFDAQMPHRLWTIGRDPAVAAWVVLNRHADSRVHSA